MARPRTRELSKIASRSSRRRRKRDKPPLPIGSADIEDQELAMAHHEESLKSKTVRELHAGRIVGMDNKIVAVEQRLGGEPRAPVGETAYVLELKKVMLQQRIADIGSKETAAAAKAKRRDSSDSSKNVFSKDDRQALKATKRHAVAEEAHRNTIEDLEFRAREFALGELAMLERSFEFRRLTSIPGSFADLLSRCFCAVAFIVGNVSRSSKPLETDARNRRRPRDHAVRKIAKAVTDGDPSALRNQIAMLRLMPPVASSVRACVVSAYKAIVGDVDDDAGWVARAIDDVRASGDIAEPLFVTATRLLLEGRRGAALAELGEDAAAKPPNFSGVLRVLGEAGTRIAATDSKGWSALHHAARAGDVAVCKLLVNAGAHVDSRTADARKSTPLVICLEQCEDRSSAIRLCCTLVELGCDVPAVCDDGRTALHFAAGRAAFRPVVDLLLDAGATNAAAKDGQTAADSALAKGLRSTAEAIRIHKPLKDLSKFATLRQQLDFHEHGSLGGVSPPAMLAAPPQRERRASKRYMLPPAASFRKPKAEGPAKRGVPALPSVKETALPSVKERRTRDTVM